MLCFHAAVAQPKIDDGCLVFNNLVVVSVQCQRKTLRFMLDSGSPRSVLFPSRGFKDDGAELPLRFAGSLTRTHRFRIEEWADVKSLARNAGIDLDGIIGFDLLKGMVALIDYANARCRFEKPDVDVKAKCAAWFGGLYESFRMRRLRDEMTLDVTVERKTLPLTVDTGASISAVETLTLLSARPLVRFDQSIVTPEGTLRGRTLSVLPAIDVQGRRIAYPTVAPCEPEIAPGVVNPRLLTRSRIVMDFPRATLFTSGAISATETAASILSTMTAVPMRGEGDQVRLAAIPSLSRVNPLPVSEVYGTQVSSLVRALAGPASEARAVLGELVEGRRRAARDTSAVSSRPITDASFQRL